MTATAARVSPKRTSGPSTWRATTNARRSSKLDRKTRQTNGNNVFRWYRSSWGRYTASDPLLAIPLVGHIQKAAARGGILSLYSYVAGNPLRYVDPTGLRKCASGRCPDCKSGVWTSTVASVTSFAFVGGTFGTVTNRCVGGDRTCRYYFWCFDIGFGAEIGVGPSGGVVLGGNTEVAPDQYGPGSNPAATCTCAEDFTGGSGGASVSAGKGIRGAAGSIFGSTCFGGSLGAGVGLGSAIKANAYCNTTLIGCD
jgi:RHS repeat-associated protein